MALEDATDGGGKRAGSLILYGLRAAAIGEPF